MERQMNEIEFILRLIETGKLDIIFNSDSFIESRNEYVFSIPHSGRNRRYAISAEMLEDIKSNPEHYKRICHANNNTPPQKKTGPKDNQ